MIRPLNKKPFQVPEGYFDQLEKDLLKIGNSLKSEVNFKTPDAYFDTLEKEVLEKVSKLDHSASKKTYPLWMTAVGFAAAIVLVLLIFPPQPMPEAQEELLVSDYIEEYYLNAIDSYELTAYMEDNDFNMEIYSPQNLSNENNE